jgi:hypothetical protein
VLLRATAGVAAASAALAGCGRDQAGLEVFVMWSGGELAAFRETLRGFETESGHRVRVVPVGEQVTELLRARLDADNPPDLAIVPLPGLIRQYAACGRVVPLRPGLGAHTPAGLRDVVTLDNGDVVGLWVKAAHKSLFWHRPSTFPDGAAPKTWDQLVAFTERSVALGRTPLSVGAADGWVVSDWFENALVGVGGGAVYDQLAKGREVWDSDLVTTALNGLGRLWSIPAAFPDGPAQALLTQYEESVVQVFATRRAELVFEGDFVASVASRFAGPTAPRTFRFPPVSGPPPLVVGGDVAALLNDTDAGRELIAWLDRGESMDPWITRGGFLSPNTTVPVERYPTELARASARQLATAEAVRFDLSDQVGGRLGGGQGRGMWRILQDFFRAVAGRRDVPGAVADAVEQAQAQLVEAGRRRAGDTGSSCVDGPAADRPTGKRATR